MGELTEMSNHIRHQYPNSRREDIRTILTQRGSDVWLNTETQSAAFLSAIAGGPQLASTIFMPRTCVHERAGNRRHLLYALLQRRSGT